MRKLAKRRGELATRVELTQLQASGTQHGCEKCRSTALRQQYARDLVGRGLVGRPPPLVCPDCFASWTVKFGGDAEGYATVSFMVPVMS